MESRKIQTLREELGSVEQQRTNSAIAASKLRQELSDLRSKTTDAKAYIFRLEKLTAAEGGLNATSSMSGQRSMSRGSVALGSPPATPERGEMDDDDTADNDGGSQSGWGWVAASPLGKTFDHKLEKADLLLGMVEQPFGRERGSGVLPPALPVRRT
jgi:hypothetical protein